MSNGETPANGVGSNAFGGNGKGRRRVGYILLITAGVIGFLDGFDFFTAQLGIVIAIGAIGMSLLISGLAKDVVALMKGAIS